MHLPGKRKRKNPNPAQKSNSESREIMLKKTEELLNKEKPKGNNEN